MLSSLLKATPPRPHNSTAAPPLAASAIEGHLLLFTTLMLILVSFFSLLVAQSHFDDTKYSAARDSLHSSFGVMSGGRVAIGPDSGLPVEGLWLGEEGKIVLPDAEMAYLRSLLAPALLDQEASLHKSADKQIISLATGMLFEVDSTELTAETQAVLGAFAQMVGQNSFPITIEGHTDQLPPQTEGAGSNWAISGKRATAVLDFLIGPGGLDPERLTAVAYAGTKPLYPTMTPQGRARNNRVDLVLDFSRLSAEDRRELAEQATTYQFQGFDFLLQDDQGRLPDATGN